MDFSTVFSSIDKGVFRPVYFLCGDEEFFIDRLAEKLMDTVVDVSMRDFDQTVLYGNEIGTSQIIESAKRFPMMSPKQLVVVKQAQYLKKVTELAAYIQNPVQTTILVLLYKGKKLDKRSKEGSAMVKSIEKNGVYFQSDKVKDYQLADWITNHYKSQGIQFQPKAAYLLSEYLGNDLGKIDNEIGKLLVNIKDKNIDVEAIQKLVSFSKDYNNFELQKAVAHKNYALASKIVHHFNQNPKAHPMVLVIYNLYAFFSKLMVYYFLKDKGSANMVKSMKISPYAVKEYQMAGQKYPAKKVFGIIGDIQEYDLKAKGYKSAADPEDLLKELIYKIMH